MIGQQALLAVVPFSQLPTLVLTKQECLLLAKRVLYFILSDNVLP